MSKKIKDVITKIVASHFYIWFLTLGVIILSCIYMYEMEGSGVIYERCIGGVAVLPLAYVLRIVVKTKKDVKDKQAELAIKKENHEYKLSKLRIKLEMKQVELEMLKLKKIK